MPRNEKPMTNSQPEILLSLGDPLPGPNRHLLALAEKLKLYRPQDRPWLPALRPIGLRGLRCACSCGGKFSYASYDCPTDSRAKPRTFQVWLGQCPACQVIYWCEV